ncbi:hypothetical protein MMC17_003436 [Xylographa soralifera]|nr:hypothetical protein [Xylographa soralifera]
MRMALLTFSLIGLQFTWGIEMTYCTPYLLQLGLTKSRTSMVWIAGPLSGLIMQPLVGVIADNSKSKWGRRRPFMIGGSVVVAFCLLVLGWTAEIVGVFVTNTDTKAIWTIALAVLSIYAVDFAINAVQSACRSLIIDTLPVEQQQLGSAWASRMAGIGHLIGYGIGTIDLVKMFGKSFGDTQFKQLTVIAALALLFAVAVTSYTVQERILISAKDSDANLGTSQMVMKIFNATMHLPRRIQAICWIQFWAWIGWFPFLFYSPTWVGETYFRYSAPDTIKDSADKLGEIGRIGSLALVIFSVVTFSGSVVLPMVVKSPEDEKRPFTPRPLPVLAPFLNAVYKHKPDLLTAWLISHLVFAAAMSLTPFVQSLRFATILIAMCGMPWALASWAPFTFIGVEINRATSPSSPSLLAHNLPSYNRLSTDPIPLSSLAVDIDSPPSSPQILRLHHLDRDLNSPAPTASTGETAGIYLGILNLFTTLPQFVGTFISMIVFAIFEPGPHRELAGQDGEVGNEVVGKAQGEGINAISVCLFIGALSSLGAAYATRRFKYVR